ncbi:sensor histidine kinase [Streptomyces uncialis]|uniref:sensor histidine kinase n=1 Tax=Streptomyces uncialis TaxID=1048205 RepID=UPI003863E921|nr:HAMP domain-containing histidine kinase [Streptomyces uncialis]
MTAPGPAARGGPLGRLRALPLRSRLALLVAVVVAVAVAAVATASWFVVRGALVDSLDESLSANRLTANQVVALLNENRECAPRIPAKDNVWFGVTVQLIEPTGQSCVIIGNAPIALSGTDKAVADGTLHSVFHDARSVDGKEFRVLTYRVDNLPWAVSVARPFSDVNNTLTDLTVLLVLAAGLGAVGAGAAGAWVARTGLRPVDQLTRAVEHVALTEDLSVRIPVGGDDEIARLSRSFNAMTAALASSRDLQQQLIADAGHELRTPLTSLRTNVELLVRSEETGRALPADDRAALLSSVTAQMTELAALIGDLQELSRPDSGSRVLVLPLHELTEAALRRARLRGPELTFRTDLTPWYVRGEAPALERALVNILDNAVKFSPSGERVEVSLRGGELTVRDHGPGIPSEELPHVFDRFWRSPSARSLPGSGLGLAIVARTVQQSGGTVALRAAPGGGTSVTVRLPGAPTPPPAPPSDPDP